MAKKSDKVVEETAIVNDELTETAIVAAEEFAGLVEDDTSFDYGEEHKAAEHKVAADELVIPMLKIVQSSSKIWKDKPEGSTIKLGDIYNTVTGEVFCGQRGILVVPIDKSTGVIERKPTSAGGDFIGKLAVDDPRVLEALKDNGTDEWKDLKTKEKTQLGYTVEVNVARLDRKDGVTALGVAMVPFAGTNVFPRRLWWMDMGSVPNTPRYAFRTLLKTKFRPSKNGGVDSYMYDPQPYGPSYAKGRLNEKVPAHAETLKKCKDFLNLLESGALGKADYSDADDSEEAQEAAALKDQAAF